MIYLDTHVVIWLYAGDTTRFTARGLELLEKEKLLISPMVLLEIAYLGEIKKVKAESALVFESLNKSIGLELCDLPFNRVVLESIQQNWTRDPFDRMIVAQAALRNAPLLTKDKSIRKSYAPGFW